MLDITCFNGGLQEENSGHSVVMQTYTNLLKRKTQTATKISSEKTEENTVCNTLFHFKNKCTADKTL